jgi:DNA-binding NarL/FixJ family response regulator
VNNTATNVISDRQLLILRMMSEGRTNIAISELLGYSESTIRQETIKIFAKLECSGREEASTIFREKLEKQPD